MCDLKKVFYSLGGGLRQSLRFEEFKRFPVIVPLIEEQKLISRYLDKKTSQIDSLVEKIQTKIKLLKEQRTSLINHYVTKGLDSNVEMKDSGVEWIGDIPSHWKTLRLCNFGLFSKGKNITKGDLVETGKPVILYSHLYTTYSRLVKEPNFFISSDVEVNSTKIFKNTFLFTSSGESKEDIGKCILFSGGETSVGGDQVIFELISSCNFDPEFLSFSFNSDFCVNQKSSNSRGEIVVHIYEKQLRDVVIPIPPENEQISIRNRLQDLERNSDETIRNLKHKNELLKEYRRSLISSVVTGKVRVTEDMI
jgi:type I restriction enzyme S subunit